MASVSDVAPSSPDAGYAPIAHSYDLFVAHPDYRAWVERVVRVASTDGLPGDTVLDCACGTGESTLALLEQGFAVIGVDAVEEMLDQARTKLPGHVSLLRAGLQELAVIGSFALVTALNDPINCLLDERAVAAAFGSIAANLHPAGRFVFDINTELTYRTFFASCDVRERDGVLFVWRGQCSESFGAGDVARATLDVVRPGPERGWIRSTGHHVQRHYPLARVARLLADAGLDLLDVRGQTTDGALLRLPDPRTQVKLICVAGHAS